MEIPIVVAGTRHFIYRVFGPVEGYQGIPLFITQHRIKPSPTKDDSNVESRLTADFFEFFSTSKDRLIQQCLDPATKTDGEKISDEAAPYLTTSFTIPCDVEHICPNTGLKIVYTAFANLLVREDMEARLKALPKETFKDYLEISEVDIRIKVALPLELQAEVSKGAMTSIYVTALANLESFDRDFRESFNPWRVINKI